MAERSDTGILVRRYAAAWAQAAALGGGKKLAEEVAILEDSLANDPQLMRLLGDPTIHPRDLAAALKSTAEKAGLSKVTAQFLSVLTAAGRQSLLPKILAAVQQHMDAADGVQNARVSSAVPLAANAVRELKVLLGQQLGRAVRLTTEVDEKLLGGVQIETDNWLVDASLIGQIARMERHLKSLPQAA